MQETLPRVFNALSDPTRLIMVERLLAEGEQTVGTLSRGMPISAPAISRHIKVLEDAGVIERRVEKQFRICRLRPEAMAAVDDWVSRHRAFWSGALDRLDELMREGAAEKNTSNEKRETDDE